MPKKPNLTLKQHQNEKELQRIYYNIDDCNHAIKQFKNYGPDKISGQQNYRKCD